MAGSKRWSLFVVVGLVAAHLAGSGPVEADVVEQTAPTMEVLELQSSDEQLDVDYLPPVVLSNGNYAVRHRGAENSAGDRPFAVSLFDGVTHERISMVQGRTASDEFGSHGMIEVGDSNLLVLSPGANLAGVPNVGAVTWVDGRTGLDGLIGLDNSLYGTAAEDRVGLFATVLESGHVVVGSPRWNLGSVRDVGAVTWIDGDRGLAGRVSIENSFHGTHDSDQVGWDGIHPRHGIYPLTDGDYLLASQAWNGVGAVTVLRGDRPTSGPLTAANSYVGTRPRELERVGVLALRDGDAAVAAPRWNGEAGAVTVIPGTPGVSGTVTAANSLHGTGDGDRVGSDGVIELEIGALAVLSSSWGDWGAVTVVERSELAQAVSANNSLVGSEAMPVTAEQATPLGDDQVVFQVPFAGDGYIAVTGVSGPVGVIDDTKALTGLRADLVPLAGGSVVAVDPDWDDGGANDVGLVVWIDPDAPPVGVVEAGDGLVGSSVGDQVGSLVEALPGGGFVTASGGWANGADSDVGAVTVVLDPSTVAGEVVGTGNSLYGPMAGDRVGESLLVLDDGAVLVGSPDWATGRGAVTRIGAGTAPAGAVDDGNSVVGAVPGDEFGTNVWSIGGADVLVDNKASTSQSVDVWLLRGVDASSGTSGLLSSETVPAGGFVVEADDRLVLAGGESVLFVPSYSSLSSVGDATLFAVRVDRSPRVLGVPGDVEVVVSGSASESVVHFSSPIVSDPRSVVSTVCVPASGSVFAVGATSVTCTATDSGGLVTTVGFDVVVSASGSVPDVVSMAPLRIVDTRGSGVTVDGVDAATGRVSAGGVYEIEVAGRANVPAGAVFAVVNVTAVRPDGRGFLTVFPCGDVPNASSLNMALAGGAYASELVAPLSETGSLCVYSSVGVDLVVDVAGWADESSALAGRTPARVLDTRAAGRTIDGEYQGEGRDVAQVEFELPVAGRAGVPASGVDAVVVNLTGVNPDGRGFVTVYPCGDRPLASSLNMASAGTVVANELVAPLSASGTICLYSSVATDLLVDVSAWIPASDALAGVTPARVFESRISPSTVDGVGEHDERIRTGEILEVVVTGRGEVPASGVESVIVNMTAINPIRKGYLTVFPCDGVPPTSSVNFDPDMVVANEIVAKLSDAGSICVYSSVSTDVAVDVVGYITEPT